MEARGEGCGRGRCWCVTWTRRKEQGKTFTERWVEVRLTVVKGYQVLAYELFIEGTLNNPLMQENM